MNRSVLSLSLGLIGLSGVAAAQNAGTDRATKLEARLSERFASADKNQDGKLSRDEAQSGMPRIYKHFDEIDTGKTGYVTQQQIEQFMAAKMAERKTGQSGQ